MDFDFVEDEQFRNSLASDYAEMTAGLNSHSWKSVHVLAGSIVEALLVEYLLTTGGQGTKEKILQLDLGEAIKRCREDGVITAKTASLCAVIREYRNLIHPGRLIRLHERVSSEGAKIAASLVVVISGEIQERRMINYGFTAAQILKKIQTDEHSPAVLSSLLDEIKPVEKIKLISRLIPDAFREEDNDDAASTRLMRLRTCHRQILLSLPAREQEQVASTFASMIRRDSSEVIYRYSDAFFRSEDLSLMTEKDATLVLDYMLQRLHKAVDVSATFVLSLVGIGNFIKDAAFDSYIELLIKLTLRNASDLTDMVHAFIRGEYDVIKSIERKSKMEARADEWLLTNRDKHERSHAYQAMRELSFFWSSIPF